MDGTFGNEMKQKIGEDTAAETFVAVWKHGCRVGRMKQPLIRNSNQKMSFCWIVHRKHWSCRDLAGLFHTGDEMKNGEKANVCTNFP